MGSGSGVGAGTSVGNARKVGAGVGSMAGTLVGDVSASRGSNTVPLPRSPASAGAPHAAPSRATVDSSTKRRRVIDGIVSRPTPRIAPLRGGEPVCWRSPGGTSSSPGPPWMGIR